MTVNKAQHFVSKFNISQFLGNGNRLYCLDKETLSINDRVIGNLPADILKRTYYYTTDTDDFDGDIVIPLENRIAPICKKLVADPHFNLDEVESGQLTDWFAFALTRSIYFASIMPIACDSLSDEEKLHLPYSGKALTLTCRRSAYDKLRKRLRSTQLSFCNMISPTDHGFLLTDQPPVILPYGKVGELGPVMLPLSHNLIATISPAGDAANFLSSMNREMGMLNLLQFGWTNRLIYSASLDTLDYIIDIITNNPTNYDEQLLGRARKPFFGYSNATELNSLWSHPDAIDQL